MAWNIPRVIIHMNKRPFNCGNALEHILQTLAEIVAIAQVHLVGQYHVDFHIEKIASVVRSEILNLENRLGKPHCHVQEDADVFATRGGASQMADMFACSAAPVPDNVDGEEETSERIHEPDVCQTADLFMLVISMDKVQTYRVER